jgi:hypothetical protein
MTLQDWSNLAQVIGAIAVVEKVIMTKKPHPEARPLGSFQDRLTGTWLGLIKHDDHCRF